LRSKRQKRDNATLRQLNKYVRAAAPEPDILRLVGEESKAKGTNRLTLKEINKEITAVRAKNGRRR